ncbi:hypothetical protein KP509_20G073100 [Ceratopteris richardii]|uniref:40S ribosomal protein S12 n=1 Tax=Ceratopteris richardii TaxID=49495 RepID=A0A8T2SK90_CERRI|nr:hypothetical protein KP509_20G073100 [Ceratopteris richardii]
MISGEAMCPGRRLQSRRLCAKKLGEGFGLRKIDSEGKARKIVGCSCVVVKDYGEEIEGLNVVQEYWKSH